MLFSVDSDICFPGETIIFPILKGPSELGLCCTDRIPHILGPKEVVKQEHTSVPSIPGSQSRFDVDKATVIATNIGHDVPNIAHVIHKGLPRVRRYCSHFLVHSFITFSTVFSFCLDFNILAHNIIQCIPSYYILGGKVLPDCLQSSWPVIVINNWLLCSILETNFMMLLVAIAANQSQVDCIGNGLTLDYLHVFQIIYTNLQVSHCPDGDRYPIVTQSNRCFSCYCHRRPSRIRDSFDGCIYIINAIQVGNIIQIINTTGACQIGRRG
jgi:hypothetical protein